MKKIFLIYIISLVLVLSLILDISYSCGKRSGTFYYDSQCKIPFRAWDFSVGFDGCVEGISAGQLYELRPLPTPHCYGPEAKWKDYPGIDGDVVCKVRWGFFCEWSFEGKYDESEGKCVECSGFYQVKAVKCGQPDDTTQKCEVACGAHKKCDEISGDTVLSSTEICIYKSASLEPIQGGGGADLAPCQLIVCDSSTICKKLTTSLGTYYCIYNSGFIWSTSLPSKESDCADNFDNDCDGKKDCEDPDCTGKQGPDGKICCQKNEDCPAKDGKLGECDSPSGKDNPDTPGYTYTCWWGPCESNTECAPGYCCTKAIEGYPERKCVYKGTIINYLGKSYLCDPPIPNTENNTQNQNNIRIIDFILRYISYIFTFSK